MAAPSFDQYLAETSRLVPGASDADLRAAYQKEYSTTPVRTQGPSLEAYRKETLALLPQAKAEDIDAAYRKEFGAPLATSLERSAARTFAHGGQFVGGLVGGLGRVIPGAPGAEQKGQDIYDYWKGVEENNAPAREYQTSIREDPGQLKSGGLWGGILGSAAGGLANPAFLGAQRATDLYDEGKVSGPKAIGLGAAETLLNFTPFAASSRLGNAALGAALAPTTAAIEAGATGQPVGQAVLESLPGVPVGAGLGFMSPGRQLDFGAAVRDYRSHPTGGIDPGQAFLDKFGQPPGGPGPTAGPPPLALPPPRPSGEFAVSPGGEAAPLTEAQSASKAVAAEQQRQAALDMGTHELGKINSRAWMAPIAGMQLESSLSPEHQQVQQEFAAQLKADPEKALQTYSLVPGTMGGKLLDTDLMRELSPSYRADRSLAPAVHEPSSAATKSAYAYMLAKPPKPGEQPVVVVLGGGPGVGKSTAIDALGPLKDQAQIIYDTNLAKVPRAIEIIQQARDAGKAVVVPWVMRDPLEAFQAGALQRSESRMSRPGGGRTVLADTAAGLMVGSRNSIEPVMEHFKNAPDVSFQLMDNRYGPHGMRVSPSSEIANLPRWEYNNLRERYHQILDQEHAAGRIGERVYRAFKGHDARAGGQLQAVVGEVLPGNGEQLQPQARTPQAHARVEPAPAPSLAPLNGRPAGPSRELITPKGRRVPVQPTIVELSDLVHSQAAGYDQSLQPRDRSRASSELQVETYAKQPNLEKTRIVVDAHGQVLSGNGRTLAQLRMDERYPASAAEYTRQLTAAGHDVSGFRRPVLVQKLTAPMSHGELESFTKEMNAGDRLAMSAAETSITDAAKLKAPILSLLHPGAIEGAANGAFVRAFLGEFPAVEQGNFLDSEGHLSAAGIRRIQNAVMAKAYGGSSRSKAVLERAMESSDNEVRSITGAMLDAAPQFAELRHNIEQGQVPREYDTTAQLTDAVERTAKMRADGRSLQETLGQADVFNPLDDITGAWMRAFSNAQLTRAAGKPAISSRMANYAEQALEQNVNQRQMFDGPRPTPLQLIDQALEAGREGPPPQPGDLFQDAHDTRAYLGESVSSRDGQLALNFGPIETRPDTTAAQVDTGKAALSTLISRRDSRAGANVLADRITRDFTQRGFTNLIGQEIRTAADLAALAQVYRDARFETLRIVYVKGDQIVGHEGFSSRMPSVIKFGPEGVIPAVRAGLARYGADGYWMSHNHPAGSSKPSPNDIYNTMETSRAVPGYRGHVVIDHNEYSTIDETGVPKKVEFKYGGYDPNANPRVPSNFLEGTPSNTPGAMAKIFKTLQTPKGFVTLITVNSRARVGGIVELPAHLLSAAQGPRALARLRRIQRESGADAYIYALSAREDFPVFQWLHERGLLTDTIVRHPDKGMYKMAGGTHEGRPTRSLFGMADQPMSLGETAQERAPIGEFVPGEDNEIGGGTYKLRQFASLEPEDLRVLTDVVHNLDGPVKSQRRGTRPWDATEEAALKLIQQKYGVTLDMLVNRKKGSTANAEQLEAYAQIISATTRDIRRLADEVVATGSHESKVALAAAKDKLGVMLAPALGYQTEAGRALNILRKTAAANREAALLLDALGDGSDAFLTEFAKKVRAAGNLDQVIGLTRAAYTPSLWDKFYEGWISGLLSGPTTHAVNMTSNAAFHVMDLAGDMASSVLSKDQHLRAVAAKVVGMIHGIPVGLKNAREAFKTEEPQIGSHLQSQQLRRAIGGKTGRVVRTPLRALVSEDEFFKAIAYHGELARIAMEQAIAEKPGNVRDRFHQILGDIQNDPEMRQAAMAAAERATFQTDLGPAGKALQGLLEKSKFGKLIVPFVRTPVNIVRQAIEFSPAAPAFEQVRAAIGRGGRDGALAWSRMAIGAGIMVGMIALAMKGLVTGNGPNDPEERALLMRQGWQPYSVRVGGKWYKYNRIDPIGTLLGFAADMHDIVGYAKPGELDKAGAAVITSFALNLGDKVFLRGITDFSQAYADPQRYLERWAQGMASSVVPNALAQVARGNDPFMRQVDTTMDAIRAKIPGLRQGLAKKLDIAGEPIPQSGDMPGNPFPNQQQKPDALADVMLRLSLDKGKPSKRLEYLGRSVDLTTDELSDYQGSVQQARWRALTPLVSSPQFKAAIEQQPDLAAQLLTKQWDAIGQVMKTRWLYQHPEVISRLVAPKAPRAGSPYADQAVAQ